MPIYLAVKEMTYNRGRFILISLIVALITTLVLFIAALAEGLAAANKEYLEKLTGELIVFQENVELSLPSSRVGRSRVKAIRRVEGVDDVGQVGFASATIVFGGPDSANGERSSNSPTEMKQVGSFQEPLDVTLIGVEPSKPGEPIVVKGEQLGQKRSNTVLIDGNVALRRNVQIGDTITLKTTQGTEEEFYDLTVVGVAEKLQYQFQPSLILPYLTWEKVRPRGESGINGGELISNIVVVRLDEPDKLREMATKLEQEVGKIEVVDRVTAYESTPGYQAQQSTLNTQRFFTLFIGILVIGGFFQIQTLQKVAQVGMLKAVGASNLTVVLAAISQIIIVNLIGVAVGTAGSFGLQVGFPVEIPVVFTGQSVLTAIISLIMIGPISGLVSVWALLKIEPLTALGLAQ
ncbi:hypothetical protein KFU94_19445 [Chloroflexi bacterium TSY]|nr:hypothetical protein [Chloroflexi bacterium TSY]